MPMDRRKLQRRLCIFYNRKAAKLGMGLTPSCCTLIERMINNGVQRMLNDGAGEREEQIQVAERNLSLYLQKLTSESQAQGIFPQVGARAFDSVFKVTGSLWPYC